MIRMMYCKLTITVAVTKLHLRVWCGVCVFSPFYD
jgi:hypothetical protein